MWFGPPGASVVAIDGELGVGQAFRLSIRHEDGHMDELVWSFREIAPPQRLVFGWSVGAAQGGVETVVTITFKDEGAVTEIELEHSGVETDGQRAMFAVGWQGCFEGLDAYYTD